MPVLFHLLVHIFFFKDFGGEGIGLFLTCRRHGSTFQPLKVWVSLSSFTVIGDGAPFSQDVTQHLLYIETVVKSRILEN